MAFLLSKGTQDQLKRHTFLCVEEEEYLRLAVTKMLRRSGFDVFEADSGSAAIEVLRTRDVDVDLILLDLTIQGIRARKSLPKLRWRDRT